MIETIMIVVLFSTLMMNGTAKKLGKNPLPSPPKKRLGMRMSFVKKSSGFTLTATMDNTTITAVEGNCPHKHPENTTIGRINWLGYEFTMWRNRCERCDVEFHLIREE